MNDCAKCDVVKLLAEMLKEHRRNIQSDTEIALENALGTYERYSDDIKSLQRAAFKIEMFGIRIYLIDIIAFLALLLSILNTIKQSKL